MTVDRSPAKRRYQRRALTAMAAYIAIVVAADPLLHGETQGVLRYAVALAPALCIVGVFIALGRYLAEEADEYLRYRTITAILWATGGMLVATTLWGALEGAGAPRVPLYDAPIIWFGCLALASLVVRWRA